MFRWSGANSIVSKWILSGGPRSSSQIPTSVSCCFVQLAGFCWVHFLWLTVTILVAADSWWAERSLLEYSRSADPTGACVRQIILVVNLALEQPGSRGWLVSLAGRLSSRGSPVALARARSSGSPGTRTGLYRHGCFGPSSCLTEEKRKCGDIVMMKRDAGWGSSMEESFTESGETFFSATPWSLRVTDKHSHLRTAKHNLSLLCRPVMTDEYLWLFSWGALKYVYTVSIYINQSDLAILGLNAF